jgi:Flp pilus assembly protein TadG
MKRRERNEAGAVLITFALFLIVLLGFTALGMEVGRWFMVRAELSKSVDAAALVAARNLSNPFVDPRTLAAEFGAENFASGSLGTPASGTGSVNFNVQLIEGNRVQVDGHVSARAMLAQLFGFNLIPVSSSGVGQQKRVEIMLVLDRSGSMGFLGGAPIRDLRRAATTFVSFFASTQDQDRMGLISFGTWVRVDRALGTNYVASMTAAINALQAVGGTNTEDAIDQSDGPQGFTDQTGIPGDRRVQQFLVFFSDGNPTAFRGMFRNQGADYDAVATFTNCERGDAVQADLARPDADGDIGVRATPTGDGLPSAQSACQAATTKWYILETRPVPGYAPEACSIPSGGNSALENHSCSVARELALQHAQELKDKRVTIYTIGLGDVHRPFLEALATSPDFYSYAPTSAQLQAIFQMVAREIKLRLVQ